MTWKLLWEAYAKLPRLRGVRDDVELGHHLKPSAEKPNKALLKATAPTDARHEGNPRQLLATWTRNYGPADGDVGLFLLHREVCKLHGQCAMMAIRGQEEFHLLHCARGEGGRTKRWTPWLLWRSSIIIWCVLYDTHLQNEYENAERWFMLTANRSYGSPTKIDLPAQCPAVDDEFWLARAGLKGLSHN